MKHSVKPRESWDINKLRNFRLNNPKENKPKMNGTVEFVYINDIELLKKLNSDKFRTHPIYPIAISDNGEEAYDLRDGFKLIKLSNRNSHNRPSYKFRGYKKKYISVLVAESWYNKLREEDEEIHHIDFNKLNNHYKNLEFLTLLEHLKKHRRYYNLKPKTGCCF